MYQRYKKDIFKQKKEERIILLYRGFQMSKGEIKNMIQNVGAFVEMEGFLSTSLCKKIAELFRKNAFITIKIPAISLKGTNDNGFA
jgi:hypothetical protein